MKSIAMLILAPFLGSLLDKCGRKKVLTLGCICLGISQMVYYSLNFNGKGYTILFGNVISGLGMGCIYSSIMSFIAFNYEDEQIKLIGITMLFNTFGTNGGTYVFGML